MAVINVLSPHLADMIAAGEVVDRPGSVVKELMENSLDAGARNITVEVEAGGAILIRVTDDGCGMAPDDAQACFLRHATSKLRDEQGLEAIATMGFRGEALAAISAVSKIELLTRLEEEDQGTFVSVLAGEVQQTNPAGCPPGTVFTVRDLFFNTPARLKFLKTDRSEGSFCVQQAARVALGRPEVSVRCLRDGKEEFFTPGDGKISSALYAILGREAALAMLPVSGQGDAVTVTGFLSSPAACRGNRATQFFFVNGRSIRSPLIQAALEQSYKNSLPAGRFPACALYLALNPGSVDVNVHPTKNEVKFSSEKVVFDSVYYACCDALASEDGTLQMQLSRSTEKKLHPAGAPERPAGQAGTPGQPGSARPVPPASQPVLHKSGPSTQLPYTPAGSSRAPTQSPESGLRGPRSPRGPAPSMPGVSAPDRIEPAEDLPVRVAGEVLHTYIIAEQGERVYFIDKHAAHERMNFDRLKAKDREIMSQHLIQPQAWRPSAEELQTLDDNQDLLRRLGFGLERYGEEDILVRSVPEDLDPAQTIPALEEICEKIREGGKDLAPDSVLQTIACKSAIKAGWDTDPREMQILAEQVVSGKIRYCPHGRPVAIALTKKQLDHQFGRT